MNFLEVAGSRTIFDSLDITESTKQDYLARLPYFLGFANRDGITRDLLLNYKKHLRSRADLSVASKNKYLAVARLTMKELYRLGYISIDLSLNVKSFQQSKKHRVEGLTDDEVTSLCSYIRELPDNFNTVRIRALVALLLYQGLRQIEICRLDVEDVRLSTGQLYVLGKGRDDRESIYLHPQTITALREYLKVSKVKHGALFTSIYGQTNGKRLSTRGLRGVIKKLLTELKISKTVHGFRHYFITRLVKHTKGDVLMVASFSRHKGIEMIKVYNDTLYEKEHFREVVKAFSEVRICT